MFEWILFLGGTVSGGSFHILVWLLPRLAKLMLKR